jgi:Leucine-rich repeat (LRR) protein
MLLEQRKAHLAKKALHEAELACSMKESLLLFEEDKLSTLLRIHIALIETEQTRLKKEDNDSAPLRDIPIFRQTKVSDIPSPILDQCSIKMENNNLQHGKMEGINSAVDLLVYEASCPFDQDPNGQLKQGLPYHSVNKEETQNGKVIPNPHGCQRMEIDRLSIAVTIPHSQTSQSSEEEVEYFDSCEYSSCSSLDDDQAFEDEAVEFGFSERSIKWDDHKSNDQLSNTTCLIIDQHAWKFERREHAKNSDVEKPWTWVFQLPEIEINMKKNVIWMVPSTISFDLSCPIVSKSGMMKMKELLQKCLFSKLWKSLKVAIDFNRASDVYRYLPNHKEQDIKSLDLSVENLKDIAFISEYRDINHLTLNVNKVTSLATLASNPSIEFLSVADNAVENCKGLESLPNLRYLNLDSNRLVEMQYMDSHKLMILSVTCNQLKAMPSFRASNLLKLDLFANQIESIESIHLKRFPNLVHLNLGKNKIQSIAVNAFAENKTLQTLILSHNKLSRLPRLSLPNLISLWCNGNQLESLDSWVSHSATSSSAIPAPPVSSFLFLPLLQKLYLQDNQISTIHPTSLSGLPLLKELDLSFNRLETVSSLDGLWVARNLACLKLNDNPIFKTFQESKFLSIKILVHFPKLSSDSMGMSTGSNSEHIMFDQMKAVYEARCEESKFFARVEQRSLLHHHGKKKFHGHRQQNHHLGSLASASVDQKIKRQMEIFQLEQDINVLRNKKLFLKRPNSLEKCDLIQTEARNHRFAFDTMRKMSQSLPTLVSSSSSAAVNHQLVSFQFTTNDQDFDKIRDLKLTSSITVAKSNADRRSHHNHNSHAENDKRKNVRIQLPVINYDQHAIAIQKVVRGFLLRCRFRRIQGKLHYQDDELDELFALEGMDMSAFDLNPDELLDDRYPGKQHTGGEYLKQGVADVPSSAFIHEEELSQPVTFVYGDHRKRKFSARKNGDSADDGNQAAGHIFVEELSRPGSSHSAVTINSAKTSARSSSDIDSMVSDDNSKKTPLKQNQAALIEEWGISDPKLMATFLKRNKKIQ